LALRHRLRKDPLESIDSGYKVAKVFNQVFGLGEDLDTAAVGNGVQPIAASL
jgi:magnesium chelatase subunit I